MPSVIESLVDEIEVDSVLPFGPFKFHPFAPLAPGQTSSLAPFRPKVTVRSAGGGDAYVWMTHGDPAEEKWKGVIIAAVGATFAAGVLGLAGLGAWGLYRRRRSGRSGRRA